MDNFKRVKAMDKKEVYSNLCIYDKRNPFFIDVDITDRSKPCYCDNCFYGRTDLAIEILRLLEIILKG